MPSGYAAAIGAVSPLDADADAACVPGAGWWEEWFVPTVETMDLSGLHPRSAQLLADHGDLPPQGGEAWLAERKKYSVTASVVGKVTGTYPSGAKGDKYAQMQAGVLPQEVLPAFVTDVIMAHGHRFEEKALALALKTHYGGVGALLNFGLIGHPTIPFLAGSVDGIWDPNPPGTPLEQRKKPRVVEVKCPWKRVIVPGGAPPAHYMDQMQALMEILDLDECDFIQFSAKTTTLQYGGSDMLDVQLVRRDPAWWARTRPQLEEFDAAVKRYRTKKRDF